MTATVLSNPGLAPSPQPVVSADHIGRYRSVVRSASPTLGSFNAGWCVASPIHPFLLAWKMFDHAVGVLTKCLTPTVVHLSQEIHQTRPVRPGEQVRLELQVLGARQDLQGMRLCFLSTIIDDRDVPFAELVTGLLAVGAQEPAPFGQLRRPAACTPTGPIEAYTRTIPVDFPRRYAEVSGDTNPIHLDERAALAAGLPSIIAHGMSVVALVTEEAIDRYAGGDAARVAGVATRFSCPVLPGEPFEISFQPESSGSRLYFKCRTNAGLALKNGWIDVRP